MSRARNGPAFALPCQAGTHRLRLGHGFKNTVVFLFFFCHTSRPRGPARDCATATRAAPQPRRLLCLAWSSTVCSSNTRGSKFLSTRFSSRLMPAAGCETTGPKQNARRSQITRRTHKKLTDIVVKNAAIMLRKEKSMSPSGARRTLSKAPF